MAEGNDLKSWLEANSLLSVKSKLDDAEITKLSDLQELENEQDVDELISELNLKVIKRKKFKKAVLKLISPGGAPTNNNAAPNNTPPRNVAPSKPKSRTDEYKQPEPSMNARNSNRGRILFRPGINVVPFKKTEYRLPKLAKHQFASQGGSGFMQSAMTLLHTVKKAVWNSNDDMKQPGAAQVKQRKGAPERLFATDDHKIILVCGKTGAGKSTLINSMMNYIYGVKMTDKFRLKLIQEAKKKGGNADSCTDHISSYRIKKPRGGNINYDLTIIDTPGFGDSRGIDKDMQILEEFKYVFNKILTNINGICFVVKSADNRLDASQTYVFNNILNLWAKDVADNIFILMTFADGKRANCIDALNKNDVLRNCKRRLKINNSAFTDDPMDNDMGDDGDDFNELFWKMGMKCFDKFFKSLDEVRPKAIEKSKQVLAKRDNIQTKIHHISMNLNNQLLKQQQINDQKRFIKKHAADIDAGKEVPYYEKVQKYVKKPSSNNLITTCIKHQRSCHPGCSVSDKRHCCMMDSHGHCEVCSCPHTEHINANYLYVLETKQVRKSNWDLNDNLRNTYNQAKKAKSRSEAQLRKLENDLKQNQKDVQNKLALVQKLRNELERIALRPKLTTVGDYIDQLIENEEQSPNRDGEKIKMLKDLKKKEEIITKLQQNGSLSQNDFLK